jgi:acetyl esterase
MTFILPQVKLFLEQIAAMSAGLPKMRDMPVAFGRQSYAAMSQLADRPALDVPWRDDKIAGVSVRIYTPQGAKAQQCFIFMHGGGWVIGDLASHHMLASEIAHQLNVLTVAIDYRLAPEHAFPAAHDDCFAVSKAVIDGAAGAMTKIYVGGDSAGGNLAAATAQHYREALAGQLLLYPATDMLALTGSMEEFASGYVLEKADMDWFQAQFVPPGTDPKDIRLSPVYGDLQALPPAVVLTCGLDPLRDQGNAYAAAMRAADTVVEHRVLEGLPHASFQLRAAMPAAQAALTQGLADLVRIAR